MAAQFAFHRSTYNPVLDLTTLHDDFAIREVVTPVGSHAGNFFNWTNGVVSTTVTTFGNNDNIPLTERPILGDDPDPTKYPLYPLKPNWAAVEVYLRCFFGGTGFTAVTNVKLLMTHADLFSYGTGSYVNGRAVDQYPTGETGLVGGTNPYGSAGPMYVPPGFGQININPTPMQVSQNPDQGFLDLTAGNSIGANGYSRYGVLQMVTGSEPVPGDGGTCDFTVYYDES